MVRLTFASLFIAAALVASSATTTTSLPLPRVHTSVHRALRKQGTVNLVVTMQGGTDAALATVKESEFATRGQQITTVVNRLEQLAQASQQQVTSLLSQEAGTQQPLFTSSTQLWITNQVYIQGATFELVEKLAQLTTVAEIHEEEVFSLPVSLSAGTESSGNATDATVTATATPVWSVQKIQAPEVWATGNTGQNIVVGIIDSGVRGTHEALRGNFRGAYGWYDPEAQLADPYDHSGHGTHVAGSVAGGNGIGVAPGAKWMACKACRTDSCLESEMVACTQFMLCPTDTRGANKDCSKAPHVINNSWGTGGGGSSGNEAIVAAWRAAGIIPVFSSGNILPACSTVTSPGDYPNVISVGATNNDDSLLYYSGTGPTKTGLIKPDVTAPGGAVYSAGIASDTAYKNDSGTSMAAPHVAGAIALLLSAKPTLTFDEVKAALTSTTDKSLKTTNRVCGGIADTVFPNNIFGSGRINVLKAASK